MILAIIAGIIGGIIGFLLGGTPWGGLEPMTALFIMLVGGIFIGILAETES